MGWGVDEEIVKERKEIEGKGRRWEEKGLDSVEKFYVHLTSKPLPIFCFLVPIANILPQRTALAQLQSFVIVLLKVILANLNTGPHMTTLPLPPTEQPTGFICR